MAYLGFGLRMLLSSLVVTGSGGGVGGREAAAEGCVGAEEVGSMVVAAGEVLVGSLRVAAGDVAVG